MTLSISREPLYIFVSTEYSTGVDGCHKRGDFTLSNDCLTIVNESPESMTLDRHSPMALPSGDFKIDLTVYSPFSARVLANSTSTLTDADLPPEALRPSVVTPTPYHATCTGELFTNLTLRYMPPLNTCSPPRGARVGRQRLLTRTATTLSPSCRNGVMSTLKPVYPPRCTPAFCPLTYISAS